MAKYLSKPEYKRRVLATIKKKRHRKKWLAHRSERDFFRYCVDRWGMSGAFYAHYYDAVPDLIYADNPLLRCVGTNYGWTGKQMVVPVRYK